jgi:hypothetical protein
MSSQLSLFIEQSQPIPDDAIVAASHALALNGDKTVRGAIYTKPEVVDFILGLAGYTENLPLHEKCLLEPSFGEGDFLLPAIKRLLKAWRASSTKTAPEKISG